MGQNRNNEISTAPYTKLAPLLPVVTRSTDGGRPRLSDEQALNGIVFVLRTGVLSQELPQKLGFGRGMTCWRRLRDWQAIGVWHGVHLALLDYELRPAEKLDFSRFSMDGASVPAPRGPYTGPNPTDRRELDGKRHLITDREGTPVTLCVTGANRHDSVDFDGLIDALPAAAGKRGRPRRWPGKLHADKGDYYARCRAHLKRHGIKDRIARKGV